MSIQGYGADILHIPGALNRPADTLSRYPLLQEEQQSQQTEGSPEPTRPKFCPPPKLSQSTLDSIKDQEDRDLVAQAEFIVAADPGGSSIEAPLLTLVSYRESSGKLRADDGSVNINSLRTNTPDQDDPDDPIIWSHSELLAAQQGDALLKPLIQYIKSPSSLIKQSIDPNITDIQDYVLDDSGILFKKQIDPKAVDTRGPEEVLVVPYCLQKRAIEAIHNDSSGNHPGPDRTCWAAHRRFFWRNMDRHLRNHAATCESCLRFKGNPHPQVSIRRYPIPDRPWQSVSIDLIGRLPATAKGNKFVLVCVDFLTRYTAAAPLTGKSAKEVAAALARIFCEHGVPQTLISDNGTEFRNKLVKELSNTLGFTHSTIAVHHPASQGLVERKNQSVMIALRQLNDERPHDWDLCLPHAILAVNSAYCSSIGDTPFFLYRHRDPDVPWHLRPSTRLNSDPQLQQVHEDIQRSRVTYKLIRENLLDSTDRQVRSKNKAAKDNKIRVDMRVMTRYIKNKPGDNKFSPRFNGPFRVISQKTPTVFRLKNLVNNKEIEAHVENLKIVPERIASLTEFPQARLPLHWSSEETPLFPLTHPADLVTQSTQEHTVPLCVPEPQNTLSSGRVTRSRTRAALNAISESNSHITAPWHVYPPTCHVQPVF